jgi:hypothetical protein
VVSSLVACGWLRVVGIRRVAQSIRALLSGETATHISFLIILAVVGVIRLTVLQRSPYPPGLDGGNWLAYGHAIVGEHLRSSTIVYPPVIPLIAVFLERILGTYAGLKALALMTSMAPAVGAYVLLVRWGARWASAILAGFLAASAATSDAMAWGGYPQLLGIGLLPIFVLTLDNFLTSGTLRHAAPPALLLSLALATSDLIGPFTALVGLLYLMTRYPYLRAKGTGNSGRNVLAGIAFAIAASLPLAPIYVSLAPGIAARESGGGVHASILSALAAVTEDLQVFWLASFVIALGASLVQLGKFRPSAVTCAAVLVPAIALVQLSGEVRLAYVIPTGIVIGLASAWEALRNLPVWGRQTAIAATVTFLLLDTAVGTQHFVNQVNYYSELTPGVVQGLERLDALSSADQLVAVSPAAHDWELGWWIEGAAHRRAIYAGNPVWLTYRDERARNDLANRIFSSHTTVVSALQDARLWGAAYLFVDKDWAGYPTWISAIGDTKPNAVVFENESVVIMATSR